MLLGKSRVLQVIFLQIRPTVGNPATIPSRTNNNGDDDDYDDDDGGGGAADDTDELCRYSGAADNTVKVVAHEVGEAPDWSFRGQDVVCIRVQVSVQVQESAVNIIKPETYF